MQREQLTTGMHVTYYPANQTAEDNLHFPAVVRAIARRITIALFSAEHPTGRLLAVSHRSLHINHELFGGPQRYINERISGATPQR